MTDRYEEIDVENSDAEEIDIEETDIEETNFEENNIEETDAEDRVVIENEGRSAEDIVAALEALLFTTGEALKADRIRAALGISQAQFDEAIAELMDRFETDDHGIHIIRFDDAYQMCTKEKYFDDLISLELAPKKPSLTDVVMETLSIIAYKQPVTKAEIERIRGVNSDHAVNKLVEYRLVKELGRLNAPGRPILFGTTEEFLRSFGVSDSDDLPAIDSLKMEDFKAEAEEEAQEKVGV